MEKDYVGIMEAAAVLAAESFAVQVQVGALYPHSGPTPTPAQINGDIWEVFRVFYAGMIGAANDPKDWPNPVRQSNLPPIAPNQGKINPSAN